MEAAEVSGERLAATGWQTVAKTIESSYLLTSYCLELIYYHRGQNNVSILKIPTPNLLKGKVTQRSPTGLFEVKRDIGKLLQ